MKTAMESFQVSTNAAFVCVMGFVCVVKKTKKQATTGVLYAWQCRTVHMSMGISEVR